MEIDKWIEELEKFSIDCSGAFTVSKREVYHILKAIRKDIKQTKYEKN